MVQVGDVSIAKSWDSCPTRALCQSRLVDGKIQSMDAVFLWDIDSIDGRSIYTNLEVGLFPAGGFSKLGGTASDMERWEIWKRQWRSSHGGGGPRSGWMMPSEIEGWATWSYTPELLLAGWLFNEKILSRAEVLQRVKERICDFSIARLEELEAALSQGNGQPTEG
jgi:hypothetical protein